MEKEPLDRRKLGQKGACAEENRSDFYRALLYRRDTLREPAIREPIREPRRPVILRPFGGRPFWSAPFNFYVAWLIIFELDAIAPQSTMVLPFQQLGARFVFQIV